MAKFPQSDIHMILARLKESLDAKRPSLDYCQLEQRSVPFDEFCRLMKCLTCDVTFTDHDIVTMARYYQDRKDPGLSLNVLLAIVHEQLKRSSWEDFEFIEEQCLHHDNVRLVPVGSLGRSTTASLLVILCYSLFREFSRLSVHIFQFRIHDLQSVWVLIGRRSSKDLCCVFLYAGVVCWSNT